MQFPYPCTRCGFCCIAEVCEIAQDVYGIDRHASCPALSFDEQGQSTCNLVTENTANSLGVGKGCCVKARCVSVEHGVQVDFASLPSEAKKKAVKLIRERRLSCLATR